MLKGSWRADDANTALREAASVTSRRRDGDGGKSRRVRRSHMT